MTKREFEKALFHKGVYPYHIEVIATAYVNEAAGEPVTLDVIKIRPIPVPLGIPGKVFNAFAPVTLQSVTVGPWSVANLDRIYGRLAPHIKQWRMQTAAYKESKEYKALMPEIAAYSTAHAAIPPGGKVTVLDYAHKKRDLQRFFASGKNLVLAENHVTTTYPKSSGWWPSKSSGWWPSERHDFYVCGTNENGTPFRHQIPAHVACNLRSALSWAWDHHVIVARQGDVGVSYAEFPGPAKGGRSVEGMPLPLAPSHTITGEIFWRGNKLFARNAVLSHTKGQHPAVTIDENWRAIVIARRSLRGNSSHD